MNVLPACMYTLCIPCATEVTQNRALAPWDQTAVSYHVNAGNWTQVLCKKRALKKPTNQQTNPKSNQNKNSFETSMSRNKH